MAATAKPVVTVTVRDLVEFSLRTGDLGGGGDFVSSTRALAGTLGHQRVQRSRPEGYEREVRLSHDVDGGDFALRVQGRIDGLLATAEGVLLEEIKTTQGPWDGTADPLHWAQAKVYGYIYAADHALERLRIQLTYLDLDTGKLTEFTGDFTFDGLRAFFESAAAPYLEWMREYRRWCRDRDDSLRRLAFPFARYRPGQRELAVAAYKTLARGGRLFLEAPTGIGKTVAVLLPALKALGEGRLERIFYLTARTIGRAVAEKTLTDLRGAGLRARAHAHGPGQNLFPGGAGLRPGGVPLRPRLLRPPEGRAAGGPGARGTHPAGRGGGRSPAPALPLRILPGPLLVGRRGHLRLQLRLRSPGLFAAALRRGRRGLRLPGR